MHPFATYMQPFAIVVLAIVHFLTTCIFMPVSIAWRATLLKSRPQKHSQTTANFYRLCITFCMV